MPRRFDPESGNVLLIILTAIALIGVLTVAIQGTSSNDGANIDKEQLALNASRVRQYAMELENAVSYVLQNGHSEVDIRFAHGGAHSDYGDITDEPSRQVFHVSGGAAEYRMPPSGIQNSAAPWDFYGGTALPEVGTNRADLIAVLPDVTLAFCQKINEQNGYPAGATPPSDGGTCLAEGQTGWFDSGTLFADPASNDLTGATFAVMPALQACVQCVDDKYYFYHVLLKR